MPKRMYGHIFFVAGESLWVGALGVKMRDFNRRIVMTLREVEVGKSVSVVKLHGEGAVRRRMMDMGITKGTEVYVRKVAPLGDPVEVTVRGYELSLRKEDAGMVEVQ